jgi:miniconductance mechanosensitive channel
MAYTFKSLAIVYMLISLSSTLFDILNLYEHHYSNLTTPNRRPIKGYIQAIKIIIFVLTLTLAVSQLLNKSPLYLFTSIGAIAAIILMIFKDQLLGFAANIQIATSDLVRLGDWIELPQFNVDGNVIEISINRIKVRNFDNTIASLPAYALLSNGVKNWRGIKEAGGRRIKQTFYIDSNTVRSCDDLLLQDLKEAKLLAPACSQEFLKGNKADKNTEISLTNLGLFRFYLQHYINSHSQIHDKMTRIVRSYLPTATGIPVELYLFTKETNSASYEAIQAEIFDHILAVLPYFKLATFQYPSATLPDLKPQQFQPVKTYKLKEKAI